MQRITVVCVIGFQGAGKTTVAKYLATVLKASYCHVSDYFRSCDLTSRQQWEESRSKGKFPPGIAQEFLDFLIEAASQTNNLVICDGFPRLPDEARELLGAQVQILVVYLRIPENPIYHSFQRQVSRAKANPEKTVDSQHFLRKILSTCVHAIDAWRLLREQGEVAWLEVDAAKSQAKVFNEVIAFLQSRGMKLGRSDEVQS